MTIILELPPEIEAKLRDGAARQDAETVRRLLTEAVSATVDATVATLLREFSHGCTRANHELTDEEFETLADELANMTPSLPLLSDYAVSREGIYADHP